MDISSFLRMGKIIRGPIIAIIFSFFAFLGYCLLIVPRLHFGLDNPQLLSVYYLILATGAIACLIVNCLVFKKGIQASSFIIALMILACTVNGFSSICAQTFLVARFNIETYGMSNEEKIDYLYTDLLKFVNYCASQIPEGEGVVVLNGSHFFNYYLYPKKVYLYPAYSLEDIPEAWLHERNIKWALSYNSSNFKLGEAKLVNLE